MPAVALCSCSTVFERRSEFRDAVNATGFCIARAECARSPSKSGGEGGERSRVEGAITLKDYF